MALRPCRECNARVSTEAEVCPHCGVRNPTDSPVAPPTSKSAQPTGKSRLCLFAFLVIVGLVVVILKSPEKKTESLTREQEHHTQEPEGHGSHPQNNPELTSDKLTSAASPPQQPEVEREQWKKDADDAVTAGDYATAIHIVWPLATQGNAKAQSSLGFSVPRRLGCAAGLHASLQLVPTRS